MSGWTPAPISDAEVVGTLIHAPSPGLDDYVSLDLKLESVRADGRSLIFDDRHEIGHPRFIRIEYRHRSAGGKDDLRYHGWSIGQRFRALGAVKRDTDRATFFEVHPSRPKDIQPLP